MIRTQMVRQKCIHQKLTRDHLWTGFEDSHFMTIHITIQKLGVGKI